MKVFFNESGLLINSQGISYEPGRGPGAEPAKRIYWQEVTSIRLRKLGLRWSIWNKNKRTQLVVNDVPMIETEDEGLTQRIMAAIDEASKQKSKGAHIGYRTK